MRLRLRWRLALWLWYVVVVFVCAWLFLFRWGGSELSLPEWFPIRHEHFLSLVYVSCGYDFDPALTVVVIGPWSCVVVFLTSRVNISAI